MGYPTNLLADGERIEVEMRPHYRALIAPAVVLVVEVFLASFLFFWTDQAWLRWLILGAAVVVAVFGVLIPYLRWASTQYVFTDRRIIIRRGILTKQGRDMPLSKVNNVSFEVPLLGRILNYGRISIESASDAELVIDDVPNVEEIQRDIYRLHEADDARRRNRSTPSDPGAE